MHDAYIFDCNRARLEKQKLIFEALVKVLTFVLFTCIALLLPGCGVQTTTVTADFRKQEGVYIVAYTDDRAIRTKMEDELVKDLTRRGMIAHPSHNDIDNITNSTRQEVIDNVKTKKLLAILVINQVARDGSNSIVDNSRRISPTHPTLQAFYEHTKLAATGYPENQEVFTEVNLFILDRGEAKHYWSGTTWSFRADGKGTAIRDISDLIAKQLAQLRRKYR